MAATNNQAVVYTAEEDLLKALRSLRDRDLVAALLALFNNQEDVVAPWAGDGELLASKVFEFVVEMGVELLVDQLKEETVAASASFFELDECAEPAERRALLEQFAKRAGIKKTMKQLRVALLRDWCHDLGINVAAMTKTSLANALLTECVLLGTEGFLSIQLYQTLAAFADSLDCRAPAALIEKRELIDAIMTSVYHLLPNPAAADCPLSPPPPYKLVRLPSPSPKLLPDSDDRAPPKILPVDLENAAANEHTVVDYGKLTVAELRKLLAERGLDTAGLKRDLVERLSSPVDPTLATPRKKSRVAMRQAVAQPRSTKRTRC